MKSCFTANLAVNPVIPEDLQRVCYKTPLAIKRISKCLVTHGHRKQAASQGIFGCPFELSMTL